jgi:hypothetical protein
LTSIEPATTRVAPPAGARFAAVLRRVRAWVLKVAVAAAVAAAVLVYAIVDDGFPDGGQAVLAVVGIIAAIAPPLMLAAFWVALGELAKLPERLRDVPLESRQHGEQLRDLFEQARSARGTRLQVPRLLWRLTRLTRSARETLTPYAPLLPLISLPFLAATAGAVVLAGIEIVVACVVAIVLVAG